MSVSRPSQIRADGVAVPLALQKHRPAGNVQRFDDVVHRVHALRDLRRAVIERQDLADRSRRLRALGLRRPQPGLARDGGGKLTVGRIQHRIVKLGALDALFVDIHPLCLLLTMR